MCHAHSSSWNPEGAGGGGRRKWLWLHGQVKASFKGWLLTGDAVPLDLLDLLDLL